MANGEASDMNSNTKVNVNWFNVNVPTILAVLGVAWGISTYINDMQNAIEEIERYRVSRGQSTDEKFNRINNTLEKLNDLPTRVTTVETQILATNARLDRLVENLTNSVEALRKDVNVVGTKVEVLSSKIDSINGVPKRASFSRGGGALALPRSIYPLPSHAEP